MKIRSRLFVPAYFIRRESARRSRQSAIWSSSVHHWLTTRAEPQSSPRIIVGVFGKPSQARQNIGANTTLSSQQLGVRKTPVFRTSGSPERGATVLACGAEDTRLRSKVFHTKTKAARRTDWRRAPLLKGRQNQIQGVFRQHHLFSEHLGQRKIAVTSTWLFPESREERWLKLHGRDGATMSSGPLFKRRQNRWDLPDQL